MVTNVTKSLEELKKVALLNSTQQIVLNSAAVLLSRYEELSKLLCNLKFNEVADSFILSAQEVSDFIVKESSSIGVRFDGD